MAQPYAAYPPAGGYYPPGYDYSGYYQQPAYDPNAYWQHQQYQQQYGAPAQAAQPPQQQQAAPPPPQEPQAPPLPADEPPPLPPDDAEASAGAAKSQETAAGTAVSAAAAGQEQQQQTSQVAPDAPSSATASQYAAQYGQHNGHYAAGYGGYYGGYGAAQPYGAPPAYGAPGYGYPAYGSYHPASANPSYAPQVPQQPTAPYPPSASPASTTTPAASSAAATPGRESRWNRAPPPASLAPGAGSRPTAIKPSTIVGSSSAGAAAGGMDAAKMAAAVSAAAAAAARLGAGGGSSLPSPSQQQQFIPVGAAAAGRGGAAQPPPGQAPGALPQSFSQYVQRALIRASGQAKQDKLKAILRTMIAEHRKAGTMWSTDWDRHPLPDLGGGSPSAGTMRSSVFDRISPEQKGGGSYYQQQGWDKDREGGSSRSRFRGSDDEDDRVGAYRGGSNYRERARDGDRDSQGRRNKRSWDDHSRHGSGSDSDDERSDSYDNDGGSYRPFSRTGSGGDDKWGGFVSKKKQRLELQAGPGRGKGRGKKQQQAEGGRGRGRGRGRANAAQAAEPPQQHYYSAADLARQAARSARFGGNAAAMQLAAYGWEDDGQPDGGFIVGTCQKLEKGYLRLTRPPAPDEVRPQPVLASALARLLGMIVSKEDKYLYYNDQFKAMRQDLTVQGIKNEFTVQVYEAHARAALEYGDNAEYNQCQAQLAILYAKGLPGAHAEFGAYRLLYQAVYALHGEGRKLLGTLRQLLGNRVGQVADSPEVQHAMQVRQALANGNVMRFFRLYSSAPLLSRRLMDAAVKQLRYKALCALVRSHKPTAIALPFLARSLGFTAQEEAAGAGAAGLEVALGALTVDSSGSLLCGCSEQRCVGEYAPCADEAQALAACLEWCQQHGAVFDQQKDLPASVLVTKECWNKLFVPVDTSKVAHGDANLDIRDFLASCN